MVINAFPAQWKTRIKTPFLSYFSVWSNAKRSDLLYFCDEYMLLTCSTNSKGMGPKRLPQFQRRVVYLLNYFRYLIRNYNLNISNVFLS